MELDFSTIKEYYKDIDKNELNTILNNCTINKTFYKFITLCIKLNINIFKKNNNDKWVLQSTKQLLSICEKHRKNLIKGYGINVLKYVSNNESNIMNHIEDDMLKLKKNIKYLDTIVYILKNIYKEDSLKKMCYYYDINYKDNKQKPIAKYVQIDNTDTYIAEYSN